MRAEQALLAVCCVGLAGAGLFAAGEAVSANRRERQATHTMLGHADAEDRSRPHIDLVFRPIDCAGSLDALRGWNALARQYPRLVHGVLALSNEQRADTALLNSLADVGIEYPVDTVTESAVLRRLRTSGHRLTPVAIIVDSAEQIIAMLDGADGHAPQRALDAIGLSTGARSNRASKTVEARP